MRRVSLVRRRDGETVPFDEARVVDAVDCALVAAGTADRSLASEIACVVSLFLEKTFYDEIPTVEQVEDMVEKVLIETGHAGAAKAFILQRERRARLREASSERDEHREPTLFDHRAICVDDAAAGTSGPYSREALARALVADGLLPRAAADEVAALVEQRLRKAGVGRAPASLVRGLAEAEVLARDESVDLRRRTAAMLPPEMIAAALLRRAARGAEGASLPPALAAAQLGGAALRCHALSDLLPADVARAHLDADLHVHGLLLPSALLTASFTPEDVKRGAAPGSGTRGAGDAALTARRLAAATGRSARIVAASATHGSAVAGAARACAPRRRGAARDDLAEEAWTLLHETSAEPGGRRVELDVTPDVPDALADHAALDGGGSELELPNGELAGIATAFAAALLRAHARGAGLPPRDLLPVPSVAVSERVLQGQASREVLRLAAEAVLRGERVVFPLVRDGAVPGGTSVARPGSRGARSRRLGEQAAPEPVSQPSRCCAGRVTLNLPRAARRAGRGNIEGFLRECDRLVDLAVAAHRARRELLAQVSAGPGGALAPLFRGARGREAPFSLATATWSIGLTGLNEALLHLSGFEMHDGDEVVARIARRVLGYLSLRVKSAALAADLASTLDADEDASLARRFLHSDRRQDPTRLAAALPDLAGYTPGVALRADAPVDLLLRVEREEPLHAYLATATLHLPMPAKETGGPDGLVAVLAKCLRAGTAVQVEFRVW